MYSSAVTAEEEAHSFNLTTTYLHSPGSKPAIVSILFSGYFAKFKTLYQLHTLCSVELDWERLLKYLEA
jgi:hypothetical protein